ncbi:MAG: 3D domain-containing protein [Methylocystaceae bacterium]
MTMSASRKRFFWLAVAVMLVAGLGLYSWVNKSITLVVDGKKVETHTFKRTVKDVLAENQVVLHTADKTNPGLDALVDDDTTIEVIRAFPVKIISGGQTKEVLTTPASVAAILEKAAIKPLPVDVVRPALNTTIASKGSIQIIKVTSKMATVEQVLPFSVERTSDATLEKGLQRTVKKGKNGLAHQQIRITLYDGKPVKQEVISSETIKEPVNQVIAMGTITSVSRGSLRFDFRQAIMAHSTAYTYTGRNTATGLKPAVGLVAVDPKVIPLGSRLYIEGYGFARAADRGGSIQGNRLDVFLETVEECRKWGVRKVKVYVLN